MYINKYIYVVICTYMCIYIFHTLEVGVSYENQYIDIYSYICVHMNMCKYVCIYIYIHTCVYIYHMLAVGVRHDENARLFGGQYTSTALPQKC